MNAVPAWALGLMGVWGLVLLVALALFLGPMWSEWFGALATWRHTRRLYRKGETR